MRTDKSKHVAATAAYRRRYRRCTAGCTGRQLRRVFHETVSYAWSGRVSCANSGAGELVSGRVDVHSLVTATENAMVGPGSGNNLDVRETAHLTIDTF